MNSFQFQIITVSDSRTVETDKSGPAIRDALTSLGVKNVSIQIVKDEMNEIQNAIKSSLHCNAIFLTGGTGFTPRDITPEAVLPLLEKRANGLEVLLTTKGLEKTHLAPLSRSVCGSIGSCLIVALPGSPSGAKDGIDALESILEHILNQLQGDGSHHAG